MIGIEAAEFESTRSYRVTCTLLIAWWVVFLYPSLTAGSISQGLSQAGDSTQQGTPYNQLVIVSFSLFGLANLPHAAQFLRTRQGHVMAFLIALYCGWSACSILWSEDPGLSIRRIIAFLLMLVGCFGLGAGFYARTRNGIAAFARHVLVATLVSVVLLAAFQLSSQNLLQFLDPRWSLKDAVRITIWAYPLGFAVLACLLVFQGRGLKQVAAAGSLFLVVLLLKGRSIIGAIAAAAMLVQSRMAASKLSRAFWLLAGCLLSSVLLDLITGGNLILFGYSVLNDVLFDWMSYITLGDGKNNITTLSGRLPLWQAVYPFIAERPLHGYGFGAFWNPSRFDEMYSVARWRATSAHNGYLDELAATGAIGLALFLSFWLYGMVVGIRDGLKRPGEYAGYVVCGWLLLFVLFNGMDSILQNFFQFPTCAGLIGIFALIGQRPDTLSGEFREMLFTRGFTIQAVRP